MLATEYAQYYNIDPQKEDESDNNFRSRVAGKLRDMGKLVEAHEVQQDAYYNDNENVITGIVGALAQAMSDVSYHSTGARQVNDDFTSGMVVRYPQPVLDPIAALLAVLILG